MQIFLIKSGLNMAGLELTERSACLWILNDGIQEQLPFLYSPDLIAQEQDCQSELGTPNINYSLRK